ncbi:MAG: CDP-diacylglycerol--serine O-phosphatidyltransferase [Thermoguttaceae bacterium]|nr:CDP-diacylglycerol--serine O-phosphatidyltransferase [Thermoguttaceae bacterium]
MTDFRKVHNIPVGILPTLFTLGNIVCGFFAIVIASRVGRPLSTDVPLDQLLADFRNVQMAGWLIFAAMVFDALDGHIARLTKSTTDFGAQLDSLCDVVSFGVAPGFLLVKMCPNFTIEHTRSAWVIAAFIASCAAMRLARFNVEIGENDDHSTFSGLPSPAAAGSIAGFAIIFHTILQSVGANDNHWLLRVFEISQMLLPFYGMFVAILMVSRLRYPHVVNRFFRGQRRFSDMVKVVLLLFVVMLFRNYTIPLLFFLFAVSGPAHYVIKWIRGRKLPEEDIF